MNDPPSKDWLDITPEYLRNDLAAEYLNRKYGFTTPKSLRLMHFRGVGPAFTRVGRMILYRPADLDAWAKARIAAQGSDRGASQVA